MTEVLAEITLWIEGRGGGGRCSILLIDPVHRCIRPGVAPSLPVEYTSKLDGLAIGPQAGSCGTAAYLGERVIVDDIATHPYWARYRDLALLFGLRACWSSPIFSPEREVLGTFAIYYGEPRRPREEELSWVDDATHLASIAIGHERSRLALASSERCARERVKELTALHHVARLLQEDPPLDGHLLASLVAVIPPAMQYNDLCAARITWGSHDATSPGFRDTPWRLRTSFDAPPSMGTLEVVYLEAPPGDDPFLPEERDLLRSIADMLAVYARRLQAQNALRQSEEHLRAVIENTPDVAIQWYDPDGRLLFLNRTSERVLGLSQASVGKTLLELGFWSASEEGRFAKARAVSLEGGAVEPLEFTFRRPDDTEGVLYSTVFRVPYAGGGYCSVCMDVELTQRRRLEAQLNQAQRLTALGTLAGGIAHDFNNLLVAIRGNADLAIDSLHDTVSAKRYLNEVEKACDRSTELVQQILMFSRKQEPKRVEIEIGQIIGEVLGLVRASLPTAIEVRTQISAEVPKALADSTQVHQLLVNLITNASHAIGAKRGTITIGLGTTDIDERSLLDAVDLAMGRYVELSVTDNGHGMDRATMRRVFEPFFTTKNEGTGLGLSVAYGIMKAHGGAITVSSKVGVGTSFKLYFPIAEPTVVRGSGNPHLLLVDDEEVITYLAQQMLTQRGYQVSPCSSPVQALYLFRAEPNAYDFLVTDVSMPAMSGLQLIEQCRALRPDLSAVLTSGCLLPEDSMMAERLGNVQLLTKPTTIQDYVNLVDRAIYRARASQRQ